MLIAIDFDKTWTEDPRFWRALVLAAFAAGHSVVMVTGRKQWSDDMARADLPREMPIVYAGDHWKQRAAAAAGYKVDVWIDDMPGMIQPPLMIGADAQL
jgi:hypothetical protein